jgi:hypothetical protein
MTVAGAPPRAVEIERLKRHYLSQDIGQLLEDRNVNFAQEIKFIPSDSQFKTIYDLWKFDDDSFDCRTVEVWLSIGIDKDGRNTGR